MSGSLKKSLLVDFLNFPFGHFQTRLKVYKLVKRPSSQKKLLAKCDFFTQKKTITTGSLNSYFSLSNGASTSTTQKHSTLKPNHTSTSKQHQPVAAAETMKKQFTPTPPLTINNARLCRKKSTTMLENIQVWKLLIFKKQQFWVRWTLASYSLLVKKTTVMIQT